jgi:predicted acetyltransferase
MPTEIRELADDDARAVFDLRVRTFSDAAGAAFDPDEVYIPTSRRLVAVDGDGVVGHLGRWAFTQAFGGRRVPMDGIAAVIAAPTHRGRGVASRLLDRALNDMHAAEVPIATLYPAAVAPYRRKGWQIAGVRVRRTVPTRSLHGLPAPTRPARLRAYVPDDLPALTALHDHVTASEPGGLGDDTGRWLRRNLAPDPDEADETVVAERDGTPVGLLHLERGDPGATGGAWTALVHRLIAADRDAELAMWRVVGSSWSVAPVTRFVSRPADPLLLDLAEEDVTDVDTHHWMTRLVDLPAAIAARGWPDGVTLQLPLEVSDPVVAANAGHWMLEVDGGQGALRPGGDGRVAVGIGALATLYTGFLTPGTAAGRGELTGATPAEVEALGWALAGPTPFLRDYF